MISKIIKPYIICEDIQILIVEDSSVFKWFQRWQNLTSFVGTFKFKMKKIVQYWNNFKDDRTVHALSGHFELQLKQTVLYWNEFKDDRTLHPSLGHFKSLLKRRFSIEMISEMTGPYIFCWDNQISTEKDSLVLK